MKKNFALILAAALLLTACSSGGGQKSASEEQAKSSEVSSAESQSAASEESEKASSESQAVASEESEKASSEVAQSSTFELGKPIQLGDYTISIKSFELIKDYDENPALKYVYDWTNGSSESEMPFMTFNLTGYQDGVETDDVFMADDVDLSIGQKNVKSGATLTDIEGAVGIADMSKPLELELTEVFSLDSVCFTHIIEDVNNPQ